MIFLIETDLIDSMKIISRNRKMNFMSNLIARTDDFQHSNALDFLHFLRDKVIFVCRLAYGSVWKRRRLWWAEEGGAWRVGKIEMGRRCYND